MPKSLKQLEREVDKLEPYLRRRVWADTTSHLIPRVLEAAGQLILELECCTDGDAAERVELLSHLVSLRKSFRRLKPVPASPTSR